MTWIPGLDIVMVWESRSGGAVANVVLTSIKQRDENLQGIWDALLSDAEDPQKGVVMGASSPN
jgi:hypothetical protein